MGQQELRREWLREALCDHEAPLLRYAQRLVGSRETARDLVQETFVHLCEADRAQVEGHLRPWLFTVCRNLAFDTRKKEKRMPLNTSQPLNERPASSGALPSAQVEAHRTASRITDALGGLPANQRDVVRLKFQDGLSYKEIAEVTGLSVSNVGYLLHHGLRALRVKLADSAITEMPAIKAVGGAA